jgi:5-methylcytosine-specific restriction endonuclease McrA
MRKRKTSRRVSPEHNLARSKKMLDWWARKNTEGYIHLKPDSETMEAKKARMKAEWAERKARPGWVSGNRGKVRSDESKAKYRASRLRQPRVLWNNKGIPWTTARYAASFERALITALRAVLNEGRNEYSFDWVEIRKATYRRDGFICQECYKKCNKETGIACHHIDYNKKNNDPQNLITLCVSCHGKTTHETEAIIRYYQDKMLLNNLKNDISR